MLTPVDRIIWAIDARETSLIIGLEKPYCSTIKSREMLITIMARPARVKPPYKQLQQLFLPEILVHKITFLTI